MINWDKVWDRFEELLAIEETKKPCPTCGHVDSMILTDWEVQKQLIEYAVNEQLLPSSNG